MPKVELIYDAGCPNVALARTRLRRAFDEAKVAVHWTEWRSDDPSCPTYARAHGSPTILVDGRDVAPSAGNASVSCRVYLQEDGSMAGAPPVGSIVAELRHAADAAPPRLRDDVPET